MTINPSPIQAVGGTLPPVEPLLSVSRGNPTPEELAAVTAVVLALQGGAEADLPGTSTRHWTRRARLHVPPQPGAGAWRRSAK